MKHLFQIAVVLAACLQGFRIQGATITFPLTNSLGIADTNAYRIIPVSTPILNNGTWVQTGAPMRIVPPASGAPFSTNLSAGNYVISNQFIVNQFAYGANPIGTSQGILFAVSSSAGTYPFTSNVISGGNVYNYTGAQFVATYANIISALGYTPMTPSEVTNAIAGVAVTNNTIVIAGNTLLTVATNGINYTVSAAPQTNNFTSLVFTNPSVVVYTNMQAALTNTMVRTNENRTMIFTGPITTYGQLTVQTNMTIAGDVTITGDVHGNTIAADGGFTTVDGYAGDAHGLTNLNASGIYSGTVPIARLSGITSNQVDTSTWYLATNLSGGIAAGVTTAVTNQWLSSISATNTANLIITTNLVAGATAYAAAISNNVVTTSNRFSAIYPTNTGSDGQFISKTGGQSAWATASGSGTGIQTNNGTGTGNIFTNVTFIGVASGTNFGDTRGNLQSGILNVISTHASSDYNFIVGSQNTIGFPNSDFVINGTAIGNLNYITNAGHEGFVSGSQNVINGGAASEIYQAILGGAGNYSAGRASVTLGGLTNIVVARFSVVGGLGAVTSNQSTFVWSDASSGGFQSISNNEFAISASNGLRVLGPMATSRGLSIGTNNAPLRFSVSTNFLHIGSATTDLANQGTYEWITFQYSNRFNQFIITNSSGTWLLRTNNGTTTIYNLVSTQPIGIWNNAGGGGTPQSWYGTVIQANGAVVQGVLTGTNILHATNTPTAGQALLAATTDPALAYWGSATVTGIAGSTRFGIESLGAANVFNVTNYGAVAYNPASLTAGNYMTNGNLTDSTIGIQAALNAASNAPAPRVVFFPAGIFQFTNSLIMPPRITIQGQGMFHCPSGATANTISNAYTILWFKNSQTNDAIFFCNQDLGASFMNGIEVCGFTNPIADMVTSFKVTGSSNFNNRGIIISGGGTTTSQNFAGDLHMYEVAVTGFRMGVDDVSANACSFGWCNFMGNDIGFQATNISRTADQCAFYHPSVGYRNGGIGYYLYGPQGLTIDQPSDIAIRTFAVCIKCLITIRGGHVEDGDGTQPSWCYAGNNTGGNHLQVTNAWQYGDSFIELYGWNGENGKGAINIEGTQFADLGLVKNALINDQGAVWGATHTISGLGVLFTTTNTDNGQSVLMRAQNGGSKEIAWLAGCLGDPYVEEYNTTLFNQANVLRSVYPVGRGTTVPPPYYNVPPLLNSYGNALSLAGDSYSKWQILPATNTGGGPDIMINRIATNYSSGVPQVGIVQALLSDPVASGRPNTNFHASSLDVTNLTVNGTLTASAAGLGGIIPQSTYPIALTNNQSTAVTFASSFKSTGEISTPSKLTVSNSTPIIYLVNPNNGITEGHVDFMTGAGATTATTAAGKVRFLLNGNSPFPADLEFWSLAQTYALWRADGNNGNTMQSGTVYATNGFNSLGAVITANGSGLTNLPQSLVTLTNWLSGQRYTNNVGRNIRVDADYTLVLASVAGGAFAGIGVSADGATFTVHTNGVSTIIGTLAQPSYGTLSQTITTNYVFYFTNLSSGSGDSAVFGTGSYTRLGL